MRSMRGLSLASKATAAWTLMPPTTACGLREVGGTFAVSIHDMKEVPKLAQVGVLELVGSAHVDLADFASIKVMEGLVVRGNAALESLAGVQLGDELSDIELEKNESLVSLEGLEGVQSLSGDLIVLDNALVDLHWLSELRSVDGSVELRSETLESLHGLEALAAIGGSLRIRDSHALTSVDALTQLTALGQQASEGARLDISDNSLLAQCSVDALIEQLVDFSGTLRYSDNDESATCQ